MNMKGVWVIHCPIHTKHIPQLTTQTEQEDFIYSTNTASSFTLTCILHNGLYITYIFASYNKNCPCKFLDSKSCAFTFQKCFV